MPKNLSLYDALKAIAKGLDKPVLYISFMTPDVEYFDEWIEGLKKAAPYLFDEEGCKYLQIVADGQGYLVCESTAELERLFDLTVGDDGPTSTNSYDGPVRVYALTSDGNENT